MLARVKNFKGSTFFCFRAYHANWTSPSMSKSVNKRGGPVGLLSHFSIPNFKNLLKKGGVQSEWGVQLA